MVDRWITSLVLVFATGLLCCCRAAPEEVSPKPAEPTTAAADASGGDPLRVSTPGYYEREAKIKKELAGLRDHPWAREFSSKGDTGYSLYLAPRNGWVHRQDGCESVDGDYGGIREKGGRLVFLDKSGRELDPEESTLWSILFDLECSMKTCKSFAQIEEQYAIGGDRAAMNAYLQEADCIAKVLAGIKGYKGESK